MTTHQTKTRKFTVDEYEQMVEVGVLTEEDRVELIQGEIVEMTPIGRRHAACVDQINQTFSEQSPGEIIVRVQSPIRLSVNSEPEPDVAVLEAKEDFYASGHPQSDEIYLIVEVGEASTSFDREQKIPLYAGAGIPEVWLIDLEQDQVEIYRDPAEEKYRNITIPSPSDEITPQEISGITMTASELLPAKK